jgi:peptide/nickel transport system ATP-binding protein
VNEAILKVEDLRVYYHTYDRLVKAVDGVSFEVRKDEVFGLVGESGSGKSTLCMGLLRLVSPPGRIEDGHVLFDGADLVAMNDEQLRRVRWKQIPFIPQGAMSALNPVMRIRDQFYDVIRDHEGSQPGGLLHERIESMLGRVQLAPNVLGKFPHELSGGMKQRVCIALAMILNPKLIIADEPTSALDVVSQRVVLETLSEVRRSQHASMILVGHDMALQAQIVDRLGVMYAGKFVEIGNVRDIFNDPIHLYTKRLTSSIPSIQKKQDIHELAGIGLTEVEKYRYKVAAQLVEVKPGHFVAQHN